jgi:hypothetical protein
MTEDRTQGQFARKQRIQITVGGLIVASANEETKKQLFAIHRGWENAPIRLLLGRGFLLKSIKQMCVALGAL